MAGISITRAREVITKEKIVQVPVSVAYYMPEIEIILDEEIKKTRNALFGFTDLDDLYRRVTTRLLRLGREK